MKILYKKGEEASFTSFLVLILIAIPIISISFAIVMFSHAQHVQFDTNAPEQLIQGITKERFKSSGNCFAYRDGSIGRSFPGFYDSAKFSQNTLSQGDCYDVTENSALPCFRFELLNMQGASLSDKPTTANFHTRCTYAAAKALPALIVQGDRITAGKISIEEEYG